MTNAQANRTRLRIWKDILTAAGGDPSDGDTLYVTVRKVDLALGGMPARNATFLRLANEILSINPHVYSANELLNGYLLPQTGKALRWGTDPDTAEFGGIIFGDPGSENIFGDPDTDFAFGRPDTT